MADFEVHVDLDGRTRPIGLARSNRVRGTDTILFEYDRAWLEDPDRFSLEPALARPVALRASPVLRLPTPLATQRRIPGAGPHAARRTPSRRSGRPRGPHACRKRLPARVADETRLGALRFRWVGEEIFQAPIRAGVPALIELGRLLQITDGFSGEETDEDLQLHLCPGSSLGGA